jgi:hypothetical protein
MQNSTINKEPASGRKTSPAAADPQSDWHILSRDGPVVATAVHDGHRIRPSLRRYLAIGEADRRREEDPLTAVLCSAADTALHMRTSRFEFDVNRPRDKAISVDPEDTWGLKIWQDSLPATEIEESLAKYDRFYQVVTSLLDRQLEQWGSLLLLDIHSYNHQRGGTKAPAARQAANPDIDLGVTTLDAGRWGELVDTFSEVLARSEAGGRKPDVRRNVRYPSGGHFPEWVYARYGSDICTISLEYKKIYMDEWTAQADVAVVEGLRSGLGDALAAVRERWVPQP